MLNGKKHENSFDSWINKNERMSKIFRRKNEG